jgi:hypothetical protein
MLYFAASTLQHAFESEEAPRKAETSETKRTKEHRKKDQATTILF